MQIPARVRARLLWPVPRNAVYSCSGNQAPASALLLLQSVFSEHPYPSGNLLERQRAIEHFATRISPHSISGRAAKVPGQQLIEGKDLRSIGTIENHRHRPIGGVKLVKHLAAAA